MSQILNHSPCDILRQLAIDLGLGTDPDDELDWPIYAPALPDAAGADHAMQFKDSQGYQIGRYGVTGEQVEVYGVQLMVRSAYPAEGYIKARRIQEAFAAVDKTDVTLLAETLVDNDWVPETIYRVHAIQRASQVLKAGRDGDRWLQTANFTAFIELVSQTTTGTA
jgi:hypothetical protein